jgi:hypothetical protein
MPDPIRITGLREFTRGLKAMDSSLPKQVRVALNDAAGMLIDATRPKIPKRSGRAARSLRPASTRRAVRVRSGGSRAPYYPWLDFGGRVGKGRSIKRPFLPDGRYLYETYYQLRQQGRIQERMILALAKAAADAGLGIETG